MSRITSVRQLEYFIAVAETASFRGAAARLRVSQPTLTNQIARLEGGLSLQLLERSRSGSLLTPAGRSLLSSARRVVEQFQGFVDQAESMSQGTAGTYRLGVTPTLGPYFLPFVLPQLHRKYDALKFFVREDAPRDLEHDLLAGEYDLVMTPLPVGAGDLTIVPLFREPLRLVLSTEHRLAGKEHIDPEDLRGEPVLALQEHHLFHRQIVELCERLGARVLRDYEGTSLDTLRQMVVMGMGITFLPALYVRSEIHQPAELRVTSVEGVSMERQHALVWRPSSPMAAMFQEVAEELRAFVAEHLPDQVTAFAPD